MSKEGESRSSTSAEQHVSFDEIDSSILEMPDSMRRVDWRWAVTKGFLNKETNQWNQEMGGKEAYLRQRNDRMLARHFAVHYFYSIHFCILSFLGQC